MKSNVLKMDIYGSALFVDVDFWSKKSMDYKTTSITFDTGATVTTISKAVLFRLGYNVVDGVVKTITTASQPEYVREVIIDKMKLGNFELENVKVYAHEFPVECFSSGVLGLDILSKFDINLLFSKKIIDLIPITE